MSVCAFDLASHVSRIHVRLRCAQEFVHMLPQVNLAQNVLAVVGVNVHLLV